jgi:hypothetical protein
VYACTTYVCMDRYIYDWMDLWMNIFIHVLCVVVSNRFAALKDLTAEVGINSV